jgi:NitT/TauT family transport system ATP-binding protein
MDGTAVIPLGARKSALMRRMLLALTAIAKSFATSAGPSAVLQDINFGIREREFVSVVGPSGCGKSTILALIAGLIKPSGGSILLDERPVTKAGPDRGMVFQRANLFPWLTVYENVTFGLQLKANRSPPRSATSAALQARAEALLDAVGLAAFRNHRPEQLSGGMRQRAALVRALVTRPRILLMDEPFGALDAQTREEMQELLLALCQQQGPTVLFVTHDIEEALILSDRVLVMRAHPGTIISEISVELPRPRSLDMRLTAQFTDLRSRLSNLLHHRERKVISIGLLATL